MFLEGVSAYFLLMRGALRSLDVEPSVIGQCSLLTLVWREEWRRWVAQGPRGPRPGTAEASTSSLPSSSQKPERESS